MTAFQIALLAGTATVSAGLQWAISSRLHRKRLERACARHAEAQETSIRFMQQAKKQIAQLQQELATARQQTTRLTRAQEREAARDVLRQSMDESPPARPLRPVDGFADTLPSLQFPADSLLGTH
ncbi:hypothetical protein [Piscinibacter sp. XHJ-5]|uniref:hypothetical protein n=1 Tax=Piscinibacter sp. XHJ-5 TaxID=3037797 RepID=UPI0024533719|nr:hypothetical protein [Piscinibacter sp. XHJ-5]